MFICEYKKNHRGEEMKKRSIILAAVMCVAVVALTGCSKELSNEFVKLTDYKGVKVEKQEAQKVTDEQVESRVDGLLEDYAKNVEVTDRSVQNGDFVNIDFEGKKDGVAFDGGSSTGFELEIGSGDFIEGFEDGIIGHNIGETFDLNLTFPDPYQNPDLAGQPVVFTVKLNGITMRQAPELNDEFVKQISDKSETVKEFKEEIKTGIQKDNETMAKEALRGQVWQKVMDNAQVLKYPEEDIKELTAQLYDQYKNIAGSYGMEFADFLSAQMQMDEETFAKEVDKAAKNQVKEMLVLDLLIDNVKADFSEEALEKKYEEFVQQFGFESVDVMKKTLKEVGTLEELERLAKEEIVKDWLVEHCRQV